MTWHDMPPKTQSRETSLPCRRVSLGGEAANATIEPHGASLAVSAEIKTDNGPSPNFILLMTA
jgi:hypothetical protein